MGYLSMFLLSAVPPGRIIDFDLQTVISVVINLFNVAVLAFVLSKLLYKPVRNFMQARSERIRMQFEQADLQEKTAQQLKAEYTQKLADIEKEREEILQAAKKLADENARRMIEGAKTEADAMRERAATEIEIERERVREEMRQAIIEVSAEMTAKLVAVSVDRQLQERLFAETMAELEEVTWRS